MPSDIDQRLALLAGEEEVLEVNGVGEKWTDLGVKPVWRVHVTQPWVVPGLRDRLEGSWDCYSADIVFTNRLFLDRDLGTHITADCEILHARDELGWDLGDPDEVAVCSEIRAAGGTGLYPVDIIARMEASELSACDAFPTPFVIMSFDLETSVAEGHILCAAAIIDRLDEDGSRSSPPEEHMFEGDERAILEGLTSLVRNTDPDLITGYNIDNFDLPKLLDRCEFHATGKEDAAEMFGWGRVPISEAMEKQDQRAPLMPRRDSNSRKWFAAGRCFIDAWWQARMALRPERETLAFVSELLFPDREDLRKLDIDASQMDREWEQRPEEVMQYCMRDALLPWEILDELRIVQRKEALAAVAKVPLDSAVNGTTSQWIDSLVIRLADRSAVAIPRTNRYQRSEQITGGYVHDVEAGLHRWVAVLDFKSMYPSIMINHNICRTTMLDAADRRESGFDEAPTGVRFLSSEIREGLVPALLVDLMAQRDQHKSALNDARAADDERLTLFHDSMQYAVKILMNSFYGVFASSFYRFTHKDIGSSITAWARHNIKRIISELDAEGNSVVYSDTDSVFVSAPISENVPTVRPSEEDGEALQEYLSATTELIEFGHGLSERYSEKGAELEFESGMSAFFSHGAKKRYIGRVFYPHQDMIVRGYETRRTDSFKLLTDAMMQLFERILSNEHEEGVLEVIELVKRVRAGQADAADLVISRGCKGKLRKDGSADFSIYSNPDGLPFVQAARKRIAIGLSFTPGMKVSWVVRSARQSPMRVEPWLLEETGQRVEVYDLDFYARRLSTALGRVTEAFGWSASELLAGNRQMSLFSF